MKEKAKKCPFLKKPCIGEECMMFTHVTMENPQTGIVKDEFICSIPMISMMQMETSKWTRGVQASVDKARSEQQDAQNRFLELAESARKPLLTGG